MKAFYRPSLTREQNSSAIGVFSSVSTQPLESFDWGRVLTGRKTEEKRSRERTLRQPLCCSSFKLVPSTLAINKPLNWDKGGSSPVRHAVDSLLQIYCDFLSRCTTLLWRENWRRRRRRRARIIYSLRKEKEVASLAGRKLELGTPIHQICKYCLEIWPLNDVGPTPRWENNKMAKLPMYLWRIIG